MPNGTTISATSGTVTTSVKIVSGATPTPVAPIKTLAFTQLTPTPNIGTSGSFVITLSAVDINGNTIVGSYPSTVTLSTNDSADLTLPSNPAVTSSGTDVTIGYDGKALPKGTVISATTGGVTTALSVTATAAVSSITLTPQGPGNLTVGYSGSFGFNVAVNDGSGNPITGAFPAPVMLTVNDATDLSFGGSTSTSVASSGASGVTISYDGKALLPGTTITASIPGYSATAALGINPVNPAYSAPAYSSLTLTTQNVAALVYGTSGSFSVVVTAYDASGNQINSSYPLPVVLTTSNTAALTFNGQTSATVTTGNSPVVVLYAGLIANPLPPPAEIPVPINGDVITATAQGTGSNPGPAMTFSTTLVHAGG
ncbi:MAG: hypothetical protein ACLPSH_05755 [Vulcanimicrobiaceae bacterium]